MGHGFGGLTYISKGPLQTDPHFWYKKVPSLSEGLQLLGANCVEKGQRQHLRFPCSAGPACCSWFKQCCVPHLPIKASGCSLFLQALSLMGDTPLIQDK